MRIAICDDDKNELEYVYTVICETFKQKNILCESKKYISAISLLEDNEKEPFDAIFLDLDMQEINGMGTDHFYRSGSAGVSGCGLWHWHCLPRLASARCRQI